MAWHHRRTLLLSQLIPVQDDVGSIAVLEAAVEHKLADTGPNEEHKDGIASDPRTG